MFSYSRSILLLSTRDRRDVWTDYGWYQELQCPI